MKLLTIVTTTYNSERYLPNYFKGVLALTNLDQIQVILVMNVPDKKEREIAQGYQEELPSIFRIVELSQRETIGASLNRGFMLVDTEFTSFLDIDDLRVPDSYERQLATLYENRDVDFTYGDFVTVRKHGETVGSYVKALEFNKREFVRGCYASPTQLFRTSLITKVGGFDEQLRSGGDFDFQVRAAFNCRFKKTPGVICYYTKEENSGSASSNVLQPIECNVILLRYGQYDVIESLSAYQYVREAAAYRVNDVKISGEWHPVKAFVPGYESMMQAQEGTWRHFFRKYRLWKLGYYSTLPFTGCVRRTRSEVRSMLSQLGWLESVRDALLRGGEGRT